MRYVFEDLAIFEVRTLDPANAHRGDAPGKGQLMGRGEMIGI
jgi:hypothetical protein